MRLFIWLCLGVIIISSCALDPEFIPVIPVPAEYQLQDGRFVINDGTVFFADTVNQGTVDVAQAFINLFNSGTGFNFELRQESPSDIQLNYIYFATDPGDSALGDEGYTLSVNENRIEIRAPQAAGLFYGMQTLRQLLPPQLESREAVSGQIWEIPCIEIRDQPRFSWRGMHLDVCRHFFPTEFIKQYIDYLAMHKINRFHWHLTEDQGWRIEIKQFPALTDVGAWRVDREGAHWRRRQPPQEGETATYGGFYTQEEIRELVAYAKERFITIIPEIEMPGHATAALASYPQYSCTGGPFYVYPGSYWPIEDIFCAGNDETFIFLEKILDEVFDLFPSEYIHIGGDEARKARWEACQKCQARIRNEGLKDEEELQSYFIKRIESYLNENGKKLIGWDEILEGGLAPNATVMSWRGMDGGIAAANAGHDVVMTPTGFCYFDYYQGRNNEPLAIGGFLPLEKVYAFEPIPTEIANDKKHHILGGQANLWTEFIPNPAHAEYMLLPRLCALSEVVWSPVSSRRYLFFTDRMVSHYDRMAWMDINFRVPPPEVATGMDIFSNETRCRINKPFEDCLIRFTTDGSNPTYDSNLYESPFTIRQNTRIKASTFLRNGRISRPVIINFYKVNPDENGLAYAYYEGKWDSIPDLSQLVPDKTGEIFHFTEPIKDIRRYDYIVLYTGNLQVDMPGEYLFVSHNDDGIILEIDGEIIIDDGGRFGLMENKGTINLDAGNHIFKFLAHQRYGDYDIELKIQMPGKNMVPIPASMFTKPTTTVL